MGSSIPPISSPGDSKPTLTVMPNTGAPNKSAIEQASDAARANIGTAGTAVPGTPGAPGEQPRVPAGVPQGGEFAKPGAVPFAQAPKEGQEGAPPAGQTIVPPGAPGEGTQAPPEGTEGAEGQQTDENAEQQGAEGDEGEGDDPLRVLLPGRDTDDEYEFVVDSPEAAERLRQLKNGYMRGNAVREAEAEVATRLEEVEGVRQLVDFDPAGFVVENILPENPKAVDHLVLYLLTQPEIFTRLAPTIAKVLQDQNEYRTVAAEQRAQRSEYRETMQTQMHEHRIVQQNFQDIQSTVAAMLPTNMKPEQQQVAYQDCLRDLKAHADRYNLLTLPVHEIPTLLARRLTALGVNPVEAAQRAADAAIRNASVTGPSGRHPAPRAGVPKSPAALPPAGNGDKTTPKPNGKSFVASAKRRADAAIPPGGAGSPGSGNGAFTARKADGSIMTTEEAIAAHRARVAKGIRSY